MVQVQKTVEQLYQATSRFVYVTTRSTAPESLLDFTTDFETDPTHVTLLAKDFLRCLFVLEGFTGARISRQQMDWAGKGACSYEAVKRFLFVLDHARYFGMFRHLVTELANRGHSVHVAYMAGRPEDFEALERATEGTSVTHGRAPRRGTLDGWSSVAFLARALGDLGRYSDRTSPTRARSATGWPGRSRATLRARPGSTR